MSARTVLRTAGLTIASMSAGVLTALVASIALGHTNIELPELLSIAGLVGALTSILFVFPLVRRDHLIERGVRSLKVLAHTDSLTGLPNRRAFFERADEVAGAGKDYAVLMIDIDHFKLLNDSWGHAAGDMALAAVAQCIESAVGSRGVESCFAGRIGGEEFGVVLADNAKNEAFYLADELCRRVRELSLEFGGRPAPLTLSIGVASGVSGPFDANLSIADRGAYRAKAAGRDRWVAESGTQGTEGKDVAAAA